MPDWFDRVKGAVNRLTELFLGLIALGLVVEILFGRSVPFIGGDTGGITGNLTNLIQSLGDNGLVGLIAIGIIIWLFQKRSPG